MYKKQKFESFLESLKGNGKDSLIESIKKGFNVCYENIQGSKFKANWGVILNAYGDWEFLGWYKTKKDAIFNLQIHRGHDKRPDKYGDIKGDTIAPRNYINYHFGTQDELEARKVGRYNDEYKEI